MRSRNREQELEGTFSDTGRRTRRLLVAEKASRSYDGVECFRDLDLVLTPGRRVGLVGPNGSGKSTLLRTLLGEEPPDSGGIRPAPQLRCVYFDQAREQLDDTETLRKALSPEGDTVTVGTRTMHVKSWARQLLFRDDQLDQPVRTLSGGERARTLIARLMRTPADVLLLDEPTNDLDIPTLEALETSLLEFEGAVVLVTHDRYLMDRVCTDLIALDGSGGVRALADLAQWEALREPQPAVERKAAPARKERTGTEASGKAATPAPPARRAKLSYNEKRELEQMEESVLAAEQRVESLQAAAAAEGDPARQNELYAELHEAQSGVDQLFARWAELEEKA